MMNGNGKDKLLGQNDDDEIFDLKPILPPDEMYPIISNTTPRIQTPPHPHLQPNNNNYYNPQFITYNNDTTNTSQLLNTRETKNLAPSASASPSSSHHDHHQMIISFGNSNPSTLSPPPPPPLPPLSGGSGGLCTCYVAPRGPYDGYHNKTIINLLSSSPCLVHKNSYGNFQNGHSVSLSTYHSDHKGGNNNKGSSETRSDFQAKEHIIAERKRREKLGQLFINLSKVVPGLKKLDKATLLGDATRYIKELQERVRVLEEEAKINSHHHHRPNNADMMTCTNGTSYSTYDDATSSKDQSFDSTKEEDDSGALVPKIKARISDKNVLIKICCKKQNRFMSRIPYEMERLNLNVLDIRAMPFGSTNLDITILAQMESGFSGTVRDIVEHLELVF